MPFVNQKFDKLPFVSIICHGTFQFGAKVFESEIKSIFDVSRCFHPKSFTEFSLDVYVIKLTLALMILAKSLICYTL